jgi:hypothetical protein
VEAQQWEHAKAILSVAETTTSSIRSSSERAEALQKLWIVLAQAQQWERAEAVISMITSNYDRAKALRELATLMAGAGAYEQLLNLIRRSWWKAGVREDAVSLFPMATKFISHKPVIGADFFKAFAWVDAFFKGE